VISVVIASLLLGCAARRDPAAGVVGPRVAEIPLWRSSPRGTKMYVLAELPDGVQRVFMVDTGASMSVLSADVAAAVGLSVQPDRRTLVGLGGTAPYHRARVDGLRVGPYTVDDLDFAVDVPGVPRYAGLVPLAGILGNNVWGHFQMAIDYPANLLELSTDDALFVPASATSLFFDGERARVRATGLAALGDARVEQDLVLEVDTGATGLVLSGSSAEDLSRVSTEGLELLFGVGAPRDLPVSNFLRPTRRVHVLELMVGGARLTTPYDAMWINYEPGRPAVGPSGMSGLLGHALLDGHRVVFDFPGGRFGVMPSARRVNPRDLHAWRLERLGRSRGADAALERSRILAHLGRMEDAAQAAQRGLSGDPESAPLRVMLARLHRADGDEAAAAALLEGLSVEVLLAEGELIAQVNSLWLFDRNDDALALARKATALAPDDSHAWVALADALRASGEPTGARRALQRANLLDEDPDGHLLRRAWISSEEGDFNAALTHVRRRIELYPGGKVAPWFYTQLIAGSGHEGLLQADLDRIVARLHPGDGPLDMLAAGYRATGEATRSHSLMEEGRSRDCVETTEDDASRANCEAWYAAVGGGDLQIARERIDAALEAAPGRAEYLDTLAVVLEAQGEVAEARDTAWRAARLVPDDVYLLWQAVRLDAALGGG